MSNFTVEEAVEDIISELWNESGDEGEEFALDSDEEYVNDESLAENEDSDGDVEDERPVAPARTVAHEASVPLADNADTYIFKRANKERPSSVPFTANAGIHADVTDFSPYDFFCLIFNNVILEHIVIETNRYAEQFIERNELRRRSRVKQWCPTNIAEMKIFFGLTFLMGIIQKPTIQSYWSTDALFSTPIFSAVMNRDRYILLMKFLHFNDNDKMPGATDNDVDKLFKVRPLVDHLLKMFQEAYTPTQKISIDESLLKWKGRLHFKQYIPNKRARYGVKLYCLCEESGYTYRFQVYTGKSTQPNVPRQFSVSEAVVVDLVIPLLNKGYHVYVDNFYTSLPLFRYLHDNGTLACGTIRSNRKGFPSDLKAQQLAVGDTAAFRCSELLALKYRDKKDVYMLTTIHDESTRDVDRRNRQRPRISKPVAICDYNKHMGGVDRSDQCIQPYQIARKSMKWYRKLAMHLIQLGILNAFILYQKSGGRKSFLQFQHAIIAELLFGDEEVDEANIKEENVVRLTERHFMQPIPPTQQKDKPQKRCRVCYKNGKRKETRYHCPCCPSKPGLCYFPCFEIYHTKLAL